ncbi:MAG TPA: tRNA (adenosine(37)-N6)-threonylcarbamoyltransferase complex transferase subunit TsaD [Patescibacteria group bacterium]|nr:tRNA (adenosine(37)-N6)-threonylcarbamoyltransferase complex transferase subunit TsaD [Patescibacteria group bacterium]
MKILAIETSCDETAGAVIKVENNDFHILSNVVSSQEKVHAEYGGIVPEVAARLHVENIMPIVEKALKTANTDLSSTDKEKKVDYIAVCAGPGLISSLMVGVETGKTLAYVFKKPLVKINHLEGHLLSFKGNKEKNIKFPAIGLIVSGGHTQLFLIKDYLKYKLIGQTRDDAVGEAFDKTAKILSLGYPGGPAISRSAEEKDSQNIKEIKNRDSKLDLSLPRPMLKTADFDMSFSGLKTALLYTWRDIEKKYNQEEQSSLKSGLAAEFQKAVVEVLVSKTFRAVEKYKAKSLVVGGGVSANMVLRRHLIDKAEKFDIDLFLPGQGMTGDNAAMIGLAAYYHIKKKDFIKPVDLKANPDWELT